MSKVLFIAWSFPPAGGMAARRMLRFVKYLPEFGWYPYVLTIKDASPSWWTDEVSLAEIPSHVTVTRTRSIDLLALALLLRRKKAFERLGLYLGRIANLMPPDPQIGWIPFAYWSARRVLARQRIGSIYTTSPPVSAHLIGWLLKREVDIPWVAEFRDEWTAHPFRQKRFTRPWQRKVDLWLERQVIRNADHIVVASPAYSNALAHHLPSNSRMRKFSVITNGFDEQVHSQDRLTQQRNSRFTVVHTGTFYPNLQPTSFLTAIKELIIEGTIPAETLRVVFVGTSIGDALQRSVDGPLKPVVEMPGQLSHRQALEYHAAADVLLLVLSPERGGATIPGKVFEYMGAGKPILAVAPPDSVVAEIIRDARAGLVVDYNDIAAIKEAVRTLYSRWTRDALFFSPSWSKIGEYSARELTRKLANLLTEVAS